MERFVKHYAFNTDTLILMISILELFIQFDVTICNTTQLVSWSVLP